MPESHVRLGHFVGERLDLSPGHPGHFVGATGHFVGEHPGSGRDESMAYKVIPRHFVGAY